MAITDSSVGIELNSVWRAAAIGGGGDDDDDDDDDDDEGSKGAS